MVPELSLERKETLIALHSSNRVTKHWLISVKPYPHTTNCTGDTRQYRGKIGTQKTYDTMTRLTKEQKAYIAGFLDGDGCINAQLVRRPEYTLHFQIRVTLTFFQKTTRHWVLLYLHKLLKHGSVRKRNDGMSEYAIVGKDPVKQCLQLLYPYLKLKKVQARRVLQIIDQLQKDQDPQAFVKLCEVVDTFQDLNDSKRRTINSDTVRSHFLSLHLLPVPVETI